jgi:hypothetical protein
LASILSSTAQYGTFCSDLQPPFPHADGYSVLALAVDRAFENGIVPIVAAGNRGAIVCPGYRLATPGDARKALTVGAIDPVTLSRPDYSGFGPTVDGRIKPEIMAPTDLWAAASNDPNAYYHSFSGTSAATPLAVGVAAVERQTNLLPLPAGFLLSRMLHEGRADTPSQESGLGLLEADYRFRRALYELGYEGEIADVSSGMGVKDYSFFMPPGADRFVVTLWWPERRDGGGVYHPSDLDVRVYDGEMNEVSAEQGASRQGVFERVVVPQPKGLQRYTVRVSGASVATISDPTPPDQADKQRYYLWMTPLKAHN